MKPSVTATKVNLKIVLKKSSYLCCLPLCHEKWAKRLKKEEEKRAGRTKKYCYL
jgi:hypothetical protein